MAELPTFNTGRGEVQVASVYISGPMTGYPLYNFPAFKAAAESLRQHGFEVYSPAEMDEAEGLSPPPITKREYTPTYFHYLQRDMALIGSGKIDAGVFLPGWASSRGARAEYRWLTDLALPTLSYPSLEWLEYRPAGRRQKA